MTGLILLLGLLLLGIGLYFLMFRDKVAKKPVSPGIPTAHQEKQTKAYQQEQTKFETAIEFIPDIVFPPEMVKEHVPDLPRSYNDTNITLMARDPETVYAYWEVSQERRNNLRQTYGSLWDNSIPVIRLYDITGVAYFNGKNANSYADVVINDEADNWYLHVSSPDTILCADLGRKLDDDTFITIVRSNYTYVPRNVMSSKVDSQWMLVTADQKKLYDRIGNTDGMSSYELFDRN